MHTAKKILIFILLVLSFLLQPVYAQTKDTYKDPLLSITGVQEDKKVHFYLFYSDSCPHCHRERNFIKKDLKRIYKNEVVFYEYEVSKNRELYNKVTEYFHYDEGSIPFTVINDEYFVGFGDSVKSTLIQKIDQNLNIKQHKTTYSLPILKEVDVFSVSIPTVSIVLGILNGVSPYSLWILLFTISIMTLLNDRKKKFSLGIFTLSLSGLVLFLSMLGVGFHLNRDILFWLQIVMGILAIVIGLFLFIQTFQKRHNKILFLNKKKIEEKSNMLSKQKKIIFRLIFVLLFVLGISLIVSTSSLKYSSIYFSILKWNHIDGILKALYILLSCFFSLVLPFLVFMVMFVLSSLKEKDSKWTRGIMIFSGTFMILLGFFFLFS